MSFTEGIKITGLDDFITPSQACIIPVKPEFLKKSGPKISLNDSIDKSEEKVTITLNDCLACSGCITTAESILINEQSNNQFTKQIKELKDDNVNNLVVVSLSPQSIASLSVRFQLGSLNQTYRKLRQFFRSISVDVILNTNFGRQLSLIELSIEVEERIKLGRIEGRLPVLASACPGWVCYAEKNKHNELLVPLISKVRSPQQMMGFIVKRLLSRRNTEYEGRKVLHVTVMPCFDKKLEASRKEFGYERGDGSIEREVDIVLSSAEIETLISESGYDFSAIEGENNEIEDWLDKGIDLCSHGDSSGAGGYLDSTLRHCARTLHGIELADDIWSDKRVSVRRIRDDNYREVTLSDDNGVLMRFAFAYGFRNVQNIVQKVRKGACVYDYVEIMACPGGCLNGGGQVRGGSEVLNEVRAVYGGSTGKVTDSHSLREVQDLLDDRHELHTSYNVVKHVDIINPAAFVF